MKCKECSIDFPHVHNVSRPPEKQELCKCCGGLIKIRNPKGYCDHLHYPENCTGKCQSEEKQECPCHCHHETDIDCDCFGTIDQATCEHCQPHQDEGMEWEEEVREMLGNIMSKPIIKLIKLLLAKDRQQLIEKIKQLPDYHGIECRSLYRTLAILEGERDR